jgi:hypothetical protein
MTRHKKIFIIGGLILLVQLILFHDYVLPFYWGQIRVTGLSCTCPDKTVLDGELYLRFITPGSLKEYEFNYSEIFTRGADVSTKYDPMGTGVYILKGEIIDKDRVDDYGRWNPVFRVDEWREEIFEPLTKILFLIQVVIWSILLFLTRRRQK